MRGMTMDGGNNKKKKNLSHAVERWGWCTGKDAIEDCPVWMM